MPNHRRWTAEYTYLCRCEPSPYSAISCGASPQGRHRGLAYLDDGEHTDRSAALASIARHYGHPPADIELGRIELETQEEADARIERVRREDARARAGTWWGMGGAN